MLPVKFDIRTPEEIEADQKSKKEVWEQSLKQLEKDKKENPGIYEDNEDIDYSGDMLEDSN